MDPKMKMMLIDELLSHLSSRDDEDLKGAMKPKAAMLEVGKEPDGDEGDMPVDGIDSKDDCGDGMSDDDLEQLLQHYSGIKE